jgi:hypothetical protein
MDRDGRRNLKRLTEGKEPIMKTRTAALALALTLLASALFAGDSPAAGVVNINTASRSQLMLLPGIGAAKAARIEAHRPYASAEALGAVPGIGRGATFTRVRPYVVIAGETTMTSKGSRRSPSSLTGCAGAAAGDGMRRLAEPVRQTVISEKEHAMTRKTAASMLTSAALGSLLTAGALTCHHSPAPELRYAVVFDAGTPSAEVVATTRYNLCAFDVKHALAVPFPPYEKHLSVIDLRTGARLTTSDEATLRAEAAEEVKP